MSSPAAMQELLLDQVDAGHQLGHRVLDLQPGIHLQEHEVPGLDVDEELDRARAAVTDRLAGRHRGGEHTRPQFRADARRRSLLGDLLVPPLDRAVALAQREHLAIGQA